LRIDALSIGNDEAQFFWLYGNLEAKIQAMVLPQLQIAEETEDWDIERIFTQLQLVFGNPSKQDNAVRLLYGIRQGSLDISGYLAKFERLLHDSRQTKLNDASKIAILVNGANDQLSKKLDAQLNLPSIYEGKGGFVEALHRLGSKTGSQIQFQSNYPVTSSTYRPPTPGPRQPSTSNDDAMDISRLRDVDDDNEELRFSSITMGGGGATRPTFVAAPQSSKLQRRAWQEAGLCRRCGGVGHRVRDCPMAPASQAPVEEYRVAWERDYGYGFNEDALHQIEWRE